MSLCDIDGIKCYESDRHRHSGSNTFHHMKCECYCKFLVGVSITSVMKLLFFVDPWLDPYVYTTTYLNYLYNWNMLTSSPEQRVSIYEQVVPATYRHHPRDRSSVPSTARSSNSLKFHDLSLCPRTCTTIYPCLNLSPNRPQQHVPTRTSSLRYRAEQQPTVVMYQKVYVEAPRFSVESFVTVI